jgi:hypothetical protein
MPLGDAIAGAAGESKGPARPDGGACPQRQILQTTCEGLWNLVARIERVTSCAGSQLRKFAPTAGRAPRSECGRAPARHVGCLGSGTTGVSSAGDNYRFVEGVRQGKAPRLLRGMRRPTTKTPVWTRRRRNMNKRAAGDYEGVSGARRRFAAAAAARRLRGRKKSNEGELNARGNSRPQANTGCVPSRLDGHYLRTSYVLACGRQGRPGLVRRSEGAARSEW